MMKYMSKLISGILIAVFSMGVVAQTKLTTWMAIYLGESNFRW